MKALRYDGPWKMSLVDLPKPRPAAGEMLLEPLLHDLISECFQGLLLVVAQNHRPTDPPFLEVPD